jgi:hypothetical protein
MLSRTMPDVRAAVLEKMSAKDVNPYKLIQMLKGKRAGGKDVPAQTIYAWLRGDNDLNSGDLGLVLDALGMKIK